MAEIDPKKRTTKACDRCRLKKAKCDGTGPCRRCRADNAICLFNDRSNSDKRNVSVEHVTELQGQNDMLVRALQTVWERFAVPQLGQEAHSVRSIHDIVTHTGVLEGIAATPLPEDFSPSSGFFSQTVDITPVGISDAVATDDHDMDVEVPDRVDQHYLPITDDVGCTDYGVSLAADSAIDIQITQMEYWHPHNDLYSSHPAHFLPQMDYGLPHNSSLGQHSRQGHYAASQPMSSIADLNGTTEKLQMPVGDMHRRDSAWYHGDTSWT